jgi:3-methyladenine DNA glycosylase AlkD
MSSVLDELRAKLKASIDERTKLNAQRFFKEKVVFYGVKTSTVNKISKKFFNSIKEMSKAKIFRLCEELLKSGIMEESFIACHWSYGIHDRYDETDFKVFERWLNTYVNNWATCDTLCNHTIGTFIEMFPKYVENLKTWANSENMWMKRGAAVSLIVPAKKGMFLEEAFGIAELLMNDREDLVQKGFGWLLKEESRVHQIKVFNFVVHNKHRMPRTALRYAIELMPDNLKKEAMKK